MTKHLFLLVAAACITLNSASLLAAEPLQTLKDEINQQLQNPQGRLFNYSNTNAQSRFPAVPKQFICSYPEGDDIYNIINKNNKIIEGVEDKTTQLAMVKTLRSFEEKIMNIAAWDLFIAANSNINSEKNIFPDSVKPADDYIPRWGAWLHDTQSSAELINPETLELNQQAIKAGSWQCQGDCLQTTLDLDIYSQAQSVKGGGVLIDQAGNPIYYESRANGLLYQNLAEGYQYNVPMDFPLGQCTTFIDIGLNIVGEVGKQQDIAPVVSVKLGWKILTDKDNARKYFTMENVNLPQGSKEVNLGLVAMHIAIKEQRQAQWRWVTFEHVDNLYEPEQGSSNTPTFYDPDCKNCCNNLLPRSKTKPAQLTRIEPLSPDTQALNQTMQSLLKQHNSVLQHYKLVRTQYTSLVTPNLSEYFLQRTPSDARNAVLEPFVLPELPSCANSNDYFLPAHTFKTGCMGCHKYATYQAKNGKSLKSDFTFITPLNLKKENINE